jgi:hypothetical protein
VLRHPNDHRGGCWPDEQAYYDADLAAARDVLGDDRFAQAWTEGLKMDEEAAVAYASRAKGEGSSNSPELRSTRSAERGNRGPGSVSMFW